MMEHYRMIDRESKRNITFQTVPFCIERIMVTVPDYVHIHDFAQLTIVTGGRAVLTVNGQETPVREGDVYFVGSYRAHSLRALHRLETVNILFFLDDLLQYAQSLRGYPGFQRLFVMRPDADGESGARKLRLGYEALTHVLRVADELLAETDGSLPGAETVVQSYFMALIIYLAREYEHSANKAEADGSKLYRAATHMEMHFAEQLSLSELAGMSYLSERQFRRLFTRHYGVSPARHLQMLRLNKARYLLRSTELNINEIAQSTGFADSNYFTRLFRTTCGASPKAYRAEYQKGEADR